MSEVDLGKWLGKVTCGDCLEVLRELPDCSVDSVITDPPYCSGGSLEAQKNTKAQGLRSTTVQADQFKWFAADNMGTAGLVWMLRSLACEVRRVLRPNRSLLVFTDWRMVAHLGPAIESSGLRWRNMLVWAKPNAGLGHGFRPAHEIVLEFTNGVTEYDRRNASNVLDFRRVSSAEKSHGAQKPVELLSELITTVTHPGGIVLDPFGGSGTTAVAALLEGREFILIEQDPRYCDIARARIADASRNHQPTLQEVAQ